ncbi:MAG: hypothetical protein A2015_14745 [Spirochaetes bacterium GWF1_31_7]|nr:MAG: hypothetical protein A2Y30_10430 [Spirochaetes bacterium GWE1_32_154]OHD47093.1 MAG: hypothetical protein A2Y29_02205 [Spirochaetes bacterium GWE2_31_10]OHD51736.1 MAG: hypothetical protein A2015_14745 [Spirochaetes bacterium GWF1_31_7]OHD76841.1 MAG: hypothetical protein A2355_05490 [Spirochaetes bacterium RIFOXYB1_FULL_32_8]
MKKTNICLVSVFLLLLSNIVLLVLNKDLTYFLSIILSLVIGFFLLKKDKKEHISVIIPQIHEINNEMTPAEVIIEKKEIPLEIITDSLLKQIENVIDSLKSSILNEIDIFLKSSWNMKSSILIKKVNEIEKKTNEANNSLKNIIKGIASGVDYDMKQSRSNIERINNLFSIIGITKENTELLKKNSDFLLIIMNTIDEISNKIHVLSINSSITAARAGDVGKPFMVIAKEIRKLSEDVKRSVEKMKGYSNILKNSITIVSDLNETVDKETHSTYTEFNELLNRIEGFFLSFSVIEGKLTGNNFNSSELITLINSDFNDASFFDIESEINKMKIEINKTVLTNRKDCEVLL